MAVPDGVAVIPNRRHGKAKTKDGHISALCNRTERRFDFSKPLFLIPRSRSVRFRFGATELIPSRPSTRRRQLSDQRNRITSLLRHIPRGYRDDCWVCAGRRYAWFTICVHIERNEKRRSGVGQKHALAALRDQVSTPVVMRHSRVSAGNQPVCGRSHALH